MHQMGNPRDAFSLLAGSWGHERTGSSKQDIAQLSGGKLRENIAAEYTGGAAAARSWRL